MGVNRRLFHIKISQFQWDKLEICTIAYRSTIYTNGYFFQPGTRKRQMDDSEARLHDVFAIPKTNKYQRPDTPRHGQAESSTEGARGRSAEPSTEGARGRSPINARAAPPALAPVGLVRAHARSLAWSAFVMTQAGAHECGSSLRRSLLQSDFNLIY